MIPSKYANALYFTPRTPWGTRVQRRVLRSHMQASETIPLPAPDEKHKLWGKELQGVGAEKVARHEWHALHAPKMLPMHRYNPLDTKELNATI